MAPVDFSPELRFLLAALRTALGTDKIASLAGQAIDWQAFLGLVDRHRVGGFLHARIGATIAEICPGGVAQRVETIARANTVRALECAATQRRLTNSLSAANIEVMAVKGLAISQQLYGSFSTRHMGDIDLLIRPADAARADALIQADGWRRTNPDFPLTPLQTRKYLQLKPEFEYVHQDRPLRLELRWRLESPTDFDSLFTHAISLPLAGATVRTLPAAANAVYLFEHGARHAWFRLFWLVDIAQMLRLPGFDATAVAAVASQGDAERAVWQGAALASELLHVVAPVPLRAPVAGSRRVGRLLADARTFMVAPPEELDSVRGWQQQLFYRMRLEKSFAGKLAVAKPHLFSPLSWRTWPLPDRWFFVYYLATPFLWLWRRARRRK